VITEVTIRLYGVPPAISSAICSFPSVEDAVKVVIKTIQSSVPVARIELADAVQMDAINRYSKLDLQIAPTLWLEFHGSEASVREQAEAARKIASEHRGADFSWVINPRIAASFGAPAMMSFTPTRRCGRARSSGRPMSACRFLDSPNASSKHRRISPLPFYRHRSLVMSETATFTSAS